MRTLIAIVALVLSFGLRAQTKNEQLFDAVQKNEKEKAEMLLKAG